MIDPENNTPERQTDYPALFAHIISDLFIPLLVPTYAMIVVMWLTPLAYLPLSTRLRAVIIITVITAVIPFGVIFTLIKMGKVSDTSISNPRQRMIPYSCSIICYIAAAFFLMSWNAPRWLYIFFFGAALLSVFSVIITRWWKISAHAGAVAGLSAIIVWLASRGFIYYAPLLWVNLGFALMGLMCWSRLYLRRHTLMQVFAGSLLGFFVEFFLLELIH